MRRDRQKKITRDWNSSQTSTSHHLLTNLITLKFGRSQWSRQTLPNFAQVPLLKTFAQLCDHFYDSRPLFGCAKFPSALARLWHVRTFANWTNRNRSLNSVKWSTSKSFRASAVVAESQNWPQIGANYCHWDHFRPTATRLLLYFNPFFTNQPFIITFPHFHYSNSAEHGPFTPFLSQ